jgi:hypothetical protein
MSLDNFESEEEMLEYFALSALATAAAYVA